MAVLRTRMNDLHARRGRSTHTYRGAHKISPMIERRHECGKRYSCLASKETKGCGHTQGGSLIALHCTAWPLHLAPVQGEGAMFATVQVTHRVKAN
uniref:Uncharacterized protein n=1 Tax=Oryza sativa subsp. japonica TaxID=39947 RepID=Q6YW07_ORYSJ|nr:hypothetical protein [Oryza sativa Japonica Group]BAD05859.1 hypothetical protein [Oryza sativa Japonica Group]